MDQAAARDVGPPATRHTARRVHITERDEAVLGFIAEHRVALGAHVQALLGISAAAAYARLRALTGAGLLAQEPGPGRRPAYRATRAGLAAVGRRYQARPLDPSTLDHDVGLAWLWLAARSGVWGEMSEVVSERRMRSADGVGAGSAQPFGVRLGGYGPSGRPRLHYPDLLLVTPEGRRVAVELELTTKPRTRREGILCGYAADARIDAVLYLTDRPAVGRAIQSSAARLGISDLVHVQPVRFGSASPRGGRARAADRSGSRSVPDATAALAR